MSADFVRAVLHYDPETGLFHWRQRHDVPSRWNVRYAGKPAGSVITGSNPAAGYIRIGVDYASYLSHRLAWLYVHGVWPAALVDHRNQVRSDNRICNLREATQSQNRCNRGPQADNTSGYKGVVLHTDTERWRAQVKIQGQASHLGLFETPELAQAAYCEAAVRLHGEFARFA